VGVRKERERGNSPTAGKKAAIFLFPFERGTIVFIGRGGKEEVLIGGEPPKNLTLVLGNRELKKVSAPRGCGPPPGRRERGEEQRIGENLCSVPYDIAKRKGRVPGKRADTSPKGGGGNSRGGIDKTEENSEKGDS